MNKYFFVHRTTRRDFDITIRAKNSKEANKLLTDEWNDLKELDKEMADPKGFTILKGIEQV